MLFVVLHFGLDLFVKTHRKDFNENLRKRRHKYRSLCKLFQFIKTYETHCFIKTVMLGCKLKQVIFKNNFCFYIKNLYDLVFTSLPKINCKFRVVSLTNVGGLIDVIEDRIEFDVLILCLIMTYGLPLRQLADACRIAHYALLLRATTCPQAMIITMAKEIARFHAIE
ncbi:hypothetical protein KUTeg_019085 [Tegillarca granosa]|uniref:Uncharacterized protein n=1 Tax=Tegillarca granosa TaxID=220873 RepID=A0ABQ9EBH3_TEGGR|nr:hypothetical protein KUTeg_019085 [Tegillarca granosa]